MKMVSKKKKKKLNQDINNDLTLDLILFSFYANKITFVQLICCFIEITIRVLQNNI